MFTVGMSVGFGGGRTGLDPVPAVSGRVACSPHPAIREHSNMILKAAVTRRGCRPRAAADRRLSARNAVSLCFDDRGQTCRKAPTPGSGFGVPASKPRLH